MSDSRRPSIRISPRRHDAGAALMLKFRPKDGAAIRNRRLRGRDVLHAMMLPILCFALAFAVKEQQGARWMKPTVLAGQPVPSVARTSPGLTSRIAPDSPLPVRLTHIEDLAEDASITFPVSLSREIRVAEDEDPIQAPTEAKAPEPALRAALNLGDQPLRAVHH